MDYSWGDSTVVAGTLCGYRYWRLTCCLGYWGLRSPIYSRMWNEGWTEAVCGLSPSYRHGPRVPNSGCACGLHACHTPQTLREYMEDPPFAFPVIQGCVEATGQIIVGPDGFRAQRMRIVALALDSDLTQRIFPGPAYSSIPQYGSMAELEHDFPPIPVDTLLKEAV